MDQICLNLIQTGSNLFELDQIGLMWFKMDQSGLNLIQIDQTILSLRSVLSCPLSTLLSNFGLNSS